MPAARALIALLALPLIGCAGGGEVRPMFARQGKVPTLRLSAAFYLSPVPGDRRLEDGRRG